MQLGGESEGFRGLRWLLCDYFLSILLEKSAREPKRKKLHTQELAEQNIDSINKG
jgi:hypothetical protein